MPSLRGDVFTRVTAPRNIFPICKVAGFALLEDTSSNYNFVVDKQTFLSDFLVVTVSHLHICRCLGRKSVMKRNFLLQKNWWIICAFFSHKIDSEILPGDKKVINIRFGRWQILELRCCPLMYSGEWVRGVDVTGPFLCPLHTRQATCQIIFLPFLTLW